MAAPAAQETGREGVRLEIMQFVPAQQSKSVWYRARGLVVVSAGDNPFGVGNDGAVVEAAYYSNKRNTKATQQSNWINSQDASLLSNENGSGSLRMYGDANMI